MRKTIVRTSKNKSTTSSSLKIHYNRREKRQKKDNLFCLTPKVLENFNSQGKTLCILFEISAAFDKVFKDFFLESNAVRFGGERRFQLNSRFYHIV